MSKSDRQLGMRRDITRRDFIHGTGLAALSLGLPAGVAGGQPLPVHKPIRLERYYPPYPHRPARLAPRLVRGSARTGAQAPSTSTPARTSERNTIWWSSAGVSAASPPPTSTASGSAGTPASSSSRTTTSSAVTPRATSSTKVGRCAWFGAATSISNTRRSASGSTPS